MKHGEGRMTCVMCGSRHSGAVSQKFCSNSCWKVYLWRLAKGFHVNKG